jgi:tetratricopeptide (TPR) repeat protein
MSPTSRRHLPKLTRRQLNDQWRREGLDLDQRAHRFRQPRSASGIGARPLESYRLANDLSQTDVAIKYVALYGGGVTASIVSRWEQWPDGHNPIRPSLEVLQRLAVIYETTATTLVAAVLDEHPPGQAALRSTAARGGLLDAAAQAAMAAARKRSAADPRTLEELDQDVERFALECLGVAHAELFPQVLDDWQAVEQLLDRRQSLGDRAHLTLLGGQLVYFLARLSFNMSDYTAARRHAALAWGYAQDIGQPVLCASVKTLQGTIAFYAGQYERSLDCLQAAQRYATPYSRARIAANTARVHTALGNRTGAERALAVMEAQAMDLPIQPGDSPYTTAAAMSAMASTLARLGEGERAEGYVRQAVALYRQPGRCFEDWGNAMLNLSASLVVRRRPEPEEAARLCLEVVGVPEGQRTETVRRWAGEVLDLLEAWRALPVVKDFAEQLRQYRPRAA